MSVGDPGLTAHAIVLAWLVFAALVIGWRRRGDGFEALLVAWSVLLVAALLWPDAVSAFVGAAAR